MTSSTSSSETTAGGAPRARVLAIVLPTLLLVGALAWMGRPLSTERSRAARQIDEALAAASPEVVLVGNSLTNAGIDEAQLARALGLEAEQVHKLWVSYSQAPTWYALLDNRLYANGHRPRLVIFVNTLEWMLSMAPDGAIAERRLADHMDGDDALILEKTFGQGPLEALHHRARQRGTALRNGWLALLRELGVGLVFGEGDAGSVRARGRALADPALERLFGDAESTDLELHARVIPIVEVERDEGRREAVPPEQSYLTDLARLVQDHGGKAIFVRVPLPPENIRRDQIDPDTLRRSLDTLRRAGAGWIDLSGLGLGAVEFADFVHMNWLGRERFTRALAERLVEADVLGAGAPDVPLPPLRIARAERIGSAPEPVPLTGIRGGAVEDCVWRAKMPWVLAFDPAPLRLTGLDLPVPIELLEDGAPLAPGTPSDADAAGCRGRFRIHAPGLEFSPTRPEVMEDPGAHLQLAFSSDLPVRTAEGREGWWVQPGTTLRLEVPERGADEALRIVARAVAFGPGGGTPTLRVASGGVAGEFEREASLLSARILLPPGPVGDAELADPVVLEIASPPDGPFLALRALVAESESREASYLIGQAQLEQPPSLRLVGISRGLERLGPVSLDWEREPPPLEGVERGARASGASFELSALRGAVPSKKALDGHAQLRARSNPLRVLRDGRPWPGKLDCSTEEPRPGRYCPAGPRVRWAPFDDAREGDPQRYGLALDGERRAQKGRWLYPGDRLRISVGAHRGGLSVDALTLSAVVVAPDTRGLREELEIRIRSPRGVHAHEGVPLDRLRDAVLRIELDDAVALDREGLEVEIATSGEAPWIALIAAALEQRWPALDD